jgi:hypothetical protein
VHLELEDTSYRDIAQEGAYPEKGDRQGGITGECGYAYFLVLFSASHFELQMSRRLGVKRRRMMSLYDRHLTDTTS